MNSTVKLIQPNQIETNRLILSLRFQEDMARTISTIKESSEGYQQKEPLLCLFFICFDFSKCHV